jgi:hypothetical protein
MSDDNAVRIEERGREKLADFLVHGHLGRALHYLARIIDAPPSLFDEIFAEERRVAWLLRINLLIQHQRYREARLGNIDNAVSRPGRMDKKGFHRPPRYRSASRIVAHLPGRASHRSD